MRIASLCCKSTFCRSERDSRTRWSMWCHFPYMLLRCTRANCKFVLTCRCRWGSNTVHSELIRIRACRASAPFTKGGSLNYHHVELYHPFPQVRPFCRSKKTTRNKITVVIIITPEYQDCDGTPLSAAAREPIKFTAECADFCATHCLHACKCVATDRYIL